MEDSDDVKQSTWFGRYLEGENIEFYIEGSGGYAVANIDLISHEIYFTKQALLAQLDPTIFLCYQTEYADASEALRAGLQTSLENLNKRSRLPLTLVESYRQVTAPYAFLLVFCEKSAKVYCLLQILHPLLTSLVKKLHN